MTLEKTQPVKNADHNESIAQKCFDEAYAGLNTLMHDAHEHAPGMLKEAASAVQKNPRLAAEAGLTAICFGTALAAEGPVLVGAAIFGTTVFGGSLVLDAALPYAKDLENKVKNIKI